MEDGNLGPLGEMRVIGMANQYPMAVGSDVRSLSFKAEIRFHADYLNEIRLMGLGIMLCLYFRAATGK